MNNATLTDNKPTDPQTLGKNTINSEPDSQRNLFPQNISEQKELKIQLLKSQLDSQLKENINRILEHNSDNKFDNELIILIRYHLDDKLTDKQHKILHTNHKKNYQIVQIGKSIVKSSGVDFNINAYREYVNFTKNYTDFLFMNNAYEQIMTFEENQISNIKPDDPYNTIS